MTTINDASTTYSAIVNPTGCVSDPREYVRKYVHYTQKGHSKSPTFRKERERERGKKKEREKERSSFSFFYLQLGSENNMRSAHEQSDRTWGDWERRWERERKNKRGRRKESRRAEATGSLIISITYANLVGETGLDAIRSNYFTLAKRLLLVARSCWAQKCRRHDREEKDAIRFQVCTSVLFLHRSSLP